jgi:hypothetical protein
MVIRESSELGMALHESSLLPLVLPYLALDGAADRIYQMRIPSRLNYRPAADPGDGEP